MIPPLEPFDDEALELLALDAELTALARCRSASDDPALRLLAAFAREVDVSVAAMGRSGRTVGLRAAVMGRGGRTDQPDTAEVRRLPARSGRPRRRRTIIRRALVIAPIVATLVLLAGMLPVNASPSSPLHPLHELIFPHDESKAEDHVRVALTGAAQALAGAGACETKVAVGPLNAARGHLEDARTWMSRVDDMSARVRLQAELSTLERRADQLAGCAHNGPTGPAGPGRKGGKKQGLERKNGERMPGKKNGNGHAADARDKGNPHKPLRA